MMMLQGTKLLRCGRYANKFDRFAPLANTNKQQNFRRKSTSALESELFSFLPTNKLPVKPRQIGRTEIRAAYYTPLGPRYLSDIFETYGSYVDGIKFAGGSFTLQ
ncbi:hypothetical protein FRC02_002998, partial [Tulasnella sp. 418]